MTDIVEVSRIRALNDDLRRSLGGGVLMMTKGVIALGRTKQLAILDAVAAFDSFEADNDPYGEGDFGALQVEGERLFFKIDLYELCQTPRQLSGKTGKARSLGRGHALRRIDLYPAREARSLTPRSVFT